MSLLQTEIVRLKQLEDDAGERARNRYKAATAEKQVRSLVFNPVATPMNRPGIKTCEFYEPFLTVSSQTDHRPRNRGSRRCSTEDIVR